MGPLPKSYKDLHDSCRTSCDVHTNVGVRHDPQPDMEKNPGATRADMDLNGASRLESSKDLHETSYE